VVLSVTVGPPLGLEIIKEYAPMVVVIVVPLDPFAGTVPGANDLV
jgi:hypothetical protein